MDSLNWGKCVLAVLWQEPNATKPTLHIFPIAAEDTTELSTDEGDEVEATIEGGETEAVRYNANKYNLTAAIRTLSERTKPLKDSNGRLTGSGAVILIPEDMDSDYALYIEKATGKMVDSFTAADGGRFVYTFRALKATSGNMVKWGKLNLTGTGITDIDSLQTATISKIEFTEIATDGETEPTKQTIYTASTAS